MYEKFCLAFLILALVFTKSLEQDLASNLLTKDICPSITATLSCTRGASTNYTVVVSEALYGIKRVLSDLCEYKDGDCYSAATTSFCAAPNSETCSIYSSSSFKVANCQNEIAEYLHVRYRCIPSFSSIITNNNICSNNNFDITEESGFISSPSFPTYSIVSSECTRRITVPTNKVINIWLFNDFKTEDLLTNFCLNDYLRISDSTGTYTSCGYKKISYENKFCSSTIYIQYKAPTSLSSLYRGFRLYYQTVDRSTQPNCGTDTPASPTAPTTPATTTKPPVFVTDQVASGLLKLTACQNEEKIISIPSTYVLFPLDIYYGVTPDGTCNTIGPQNCRSPAELICDTPDTCKISLKTTVPLPDCGNKNANYIGAEYRLTPTVSSSANKNFTICSTSLVTDINGTVSPNGVITSPNYPAFTPYNSCNRRIIAADGKQIRMFLNDIKIESADGTNCPNGYLTILTECETFKICGDKSDLDTRIFTSCSNMVQIFYHSTVAEPIDTLRGFNLYYEVVTPDNALLKPGVGACLGSYANLKCDAGLTSNFTVFYYETVYGVKSVSTNPCEYKEGDCYQPSTFTSCVSDTSSTCDLYASALTSNLQNCGNKKPDYLFARYFCIPMYSTSIRNYNICDRTLTDITDSNGFISNANFPNYNTVTTECQQRIVAPANKIIKIWLFIDIQSDSTNVCASNYLKITDTTGTYKACGWKKVSYNNLLCSNVIYVSYLAPAALSSTLYRGFRLYYEFFDRISQPDCLTGTPGVPTTTTTTQTTTTPPVVFDLAARPSNSTFICRGSEVTIPVPKNFTLFPIDLYYGATQNGQCSSINSQDCKSVATISCSFNENCKISLYNDIVLNDCSNKIADYIAFEYRLIPPISTRNSSVCATTTLNLTSSGYGVMTSPNFPTFETYKDCVRTILAPVGRVIKIFVTDIGLGEPDLNGECNNGFLELISDCETVKYCGAKPVGQSHSAYIFTSCSNKLTVNYASLNPNALTSTVVLRGFNLYYEATALDSVSSLAIGEVCAGSTLALTCDATVDTKFTPYVSESFYGKRTNTSQGCRYVPGDCFDGLSTDFCGTSLTSTCSIYSSSFKTLPKCNNLYGDYFHAKHRCVPNSSTKIKAYNVCADQTIDLTESQGFIQSASYPSYTTVPNECTRRIVAPNDKVIKVWVNVDMKSAVSNECLTDYFKITDNTGTYSGCGWKKYSYDNVLCSSVIYVSFKAPTSLSSTIYKGFQAYYEFADRNTQIDCPTDTPGSPTTTTPTTTTPPLIQDLFASTLNKATVCLGNQTTIQIPNNFKLYPINVFYGVTTDNTCRTTANDCKVPTQLQCSLQGSCTISLYNDVPVAECGNTAIANYIGIEYRFIPFISTKNYTICDSTQITLTNTTSYGIITNPNYPQWESNKNCNRKLVAPMGRIFKVYLNDFALEQPSANGSCLNGYIKFESECNSVTYCGEKSTSNDYIFETCTNSLIVTYVASQSTNNDYRGFNMYYEVTVRDSGVSSLITQDICTSSTASLTCGSSFYTSYGPFLTEGLYGVKPAPVNNTCAYSPEDCFGPSTSTCSVGFPSSCSQTALSTGIANCANKRPDYLHLRFKCVPLTSSLIPTYNICNSTIGDLTRFNGFIQSPNYPSYLSISNECVVKIVAPADKIVKVWVIEIDIKSAESGNQCPTDYLQITDNTGTYRVCGWKKIGYDNELCSSTVYLNYKTPASLSTTLFHGLKLYYEFVDRSLQPSCSTATPLPPTIQPTTTQTTTPRPLVNNLAATGIFTATACKGQSSSITIPIDYQLYPINVYYGVTPNNTCTSISLQNCRSPATLTCQLQGTCSFSLLTDIVLADCGNKVANYIRVDYRLLPLVSTRNSTLCESNNLVLNATSGGIITSPDYPNNKQNINCSRTLTAPSGKVIRVYLNDLFMDYPDENNICQKGSLTFESICDSVTYCGEKQLTGGYIFQTCSNTLDINYISSSGYDTFRGFNMFYEVTVPDAIASSITRDICAGSTATITCDTSTNTNFTLVVSEALNGLKASSANKCGYTEGDCNAASTSSYCTTTTNTCSVTASSFTTIARCNDKYADYLSLRYRCVPFASTVIKEYNICEKEIIGGDIIEDRGLISSPNYPTFSIVNNSCTVKIKAPSNKIVNVWMPDVYIKSPETNNDCLTDYVTITHNSGVLKACGNKKYSFENRLCSSEIFISYKTTVTSTLYRGFKLYYEFIDRSTQPNCPTYLPTTTTTQAFITTTPSTKPLIVDLVASEIQDDFVCLGDRKTINVPNQYNLFVINYFYGVSSDGSCKKESNDCQSPSAYPCPTDSSCEISFYNDVFLDDCGRKRANYIGIEYRNIPLYSSQNHSICEEEQIDLSNSQYGVITSPKYPKWTANVKCGIKLSSDSSKTIRVFISDLNTEVADEQGSCRLGSLTLTSGNIMKRYCGDKTEFGEYVFLSCDNNLVINYTSSSILSTTNRGFNLYYEVIDKQDVSCPITFDNFTRETRPPTVITEKPVNQHNSSHLTGISLGLGLPLLVLIICIVMYLSRRMRNYGGDESKITFSKLQNADTYSNPNFS